MKNGTFFSKYRLSEQDFCSSEINPEVGNGCLKVWENVSFSLQWYSSYNKYFKNDIF